MAFNKFKPSFKYLFSYISLISTSYPVPIFSNISNFPSILFFPYLAVLFVPLIGVFENGTFLMSNPIPISLWYIPIFLDK